jgi:hypothetical protein
MIVTKEEFHRYCDVQRKGKVNMVSQDVQVLACIDKSTHRYILSNYSKLEQEYGQQE